MSPNSGAITQHDGYSPHTVRLAWILALAYLLVVVYASLQPFSGWRAPPPDILQFLAAPWPRFITLQDVVVNFGAYLPLGLLLSVGFGARLGPVRGVVVATLGAALLSLCMEFAQTLLPARIASNVDLIANSLGALVGAMAAPLLAPSRAIGSRLHAARHRLFLDGMVADVGLVLVALWLATQLHPDARLFGTGALRATFDLPAPFAHTPALAFGGEAAVALLNLLGVGMLLVALMQEERRPLMVVTVVIAIALAAKLFTNIALLQAPAPLARFTPGALGGVIAGLILVQAAAGLPRAALFAGAAACVMLATVTINVLPESPYHVVPPRLLARGASHFLSFAGIIRALSELWPLLAVSYLMAALAGQAKDGGRNPL